MIKIITIITKFIVATILAMFCTSCKIDLGNGIKGSGNITTETRTATNEFKNIEVSQGIEVQVEQGKTQSINVEADDNLQQHITTNIENGILRIETDASYNASQTPIVHVIMPTINGLSASSGAQISTNSCIVSNNLIVKSSSGSRISVEVEADFISLDSSSGSTLEANGKALKLEADSSSGSTIDAENLMTNEVIARTNSGSSISVHPIIKLDAKSSSGGSINYVKIPKTITKEENSGGSVSQR